SPVGALRYTGSGGRASDGVVTGDLGRERAAVSVSEFPVSRVAGVADRVPPHDVAAEQCVLGSMVLSKDAIADVIEEVRGSDFYRPAHETVFEAILDLYGRGEPADAVTVAAELQRRGELTRVGGA